MGCVAAALGVAMRFPGQSAILPVLAAIGALVALGSAMASPLPRHGLGQLAVPRISGLFLGYIAAVSILGPPLASGAFAVAAYSGRATGLMGPWMAAIGFGLFAQGLVGEGFGLLSPLSAFGRLLWDLLASS